MRDTKFLKIIQSATEEPPELTESNGNKVDTEQALNDWKRRRHTIFYGNKPVKQEDVSPAKTP